MGQPPVDNKTDQTASIAALSVAILDDVRTLLQKQLELFGVEVGERLASSSRWLLVAMGLIGLAVFGVQLVIVGAILYWAQTQNFPLSLSFLFAGLGVLAVCVSGVVLAMLQVRRAGSSLESPKVFNQAMRDVFQRPVKQS